MGKKGKRWGYLMEPVAVVEGVEVDNPRFNDDFKRWYDNMARKGVGSANLNARSLFRFTNKIGLTIEEFTSATKEDLQSGENLIMDFVSEQFDEGKAPGYINNYVKTIRNWLRFNGVLLVRKIYTGNNNLTPTIEDEVIPDKDEMSQIINCATMRGRCSISFIAFAGLRPMTLGNATGIDGLKVKDIPDLILDSNLVSFKKMPVRIIVRPELSKTKRQYETFLTTEGSRFLKAYLENRMSRGEKLDRQSAIISVKSGFESAKFRKDAIAVNGTRGWHIATKTVTQEIRNAIRPRFSWRPYVLRSFFATNLLIAESAGKITNSYRRFFQGHSGGMLARYTIDKHLPENVIEDMRSSFLQSEEYLSTVGLVSEEDMRKKQMMDMGKILGFGDEKMAKLTAILEMSKTADEAAEKFRNLVEQPEQSKGGYEIVESEAEMLELLDEGWTLERELNGGDKFLVKRN